MATLKPICLPLRNVQEMNRYCSNGKECITSRFLECFPKNIHLKNLYIKLISKDLLITLPYKNRPVFFNSMSHFLLILGWEKTNASKKWLALVSETYNRWEFFNLKDLEKAVNINYTYCNIIKSVIVFFNKSFILNWWKNTDQVIGSTENQLMASWEAVFWLYSCEFWSIPATHTFTHKQ